MTTFWKILIAVIVILVVITLVLGLALGFQSAKVTVASPGAYVVGTISPGQYVAYVPFTYSGTRQLSKAFMKRGWLSTDAITGSTIYGRVGAVASPDNKSGYIVLEFATSKPLSTPTFSGDYKAAASNATISAVRTLIGGFPPNMDLSTFTTGNKDTLRLWFI